MKFKKKLELLKNFNDTWLLIQIVWLISFLPIFIRIFSIPKLLQFLTPLKLAGNCGRHTIDKITKFTEFILRRNIFCFRENCLKKSLVLYYFLSKHGYPVYINFGVKRVNGKLTGHGWLTMEKTFFTEEIAPGENFTKIYSFPQGQ